MKVYFATKNKHKLMEAKAVLAESDIDVEQIKASYPEDKDDLMENVARKGARLVADKLKKPVVVEDTGLFFEAYPGFPGPMPKFVFEKIGYEGIFRLLKDRNRNAYFKTVAAYCESGEEPILFDGVMKGRITEKVFNEDRDAMPYDRIFVPDGYDVTISDMELETKNSFSQRAQAFKKLARYLTEDKK